jgi:hypothetical protein
MILYLKRHEKLHQKNPRHHKQLQQCSRIQNQFKKSVKFLYTNSEQIEEEYRKRIPFTVLSKTFLGINLMKNVKDLCKESINNQRKKSKKTIEDGKISHAHRFIESTKWKWLYYQNNLHVQCNFHQNPNDIHHRD